eukprot:scaffold5979_cov69-Phaeocystis_antarctica.AAC.2
MVHSGGFGTLTTGLTDPTRVRHGSWLLLTPRSGAAGRLPLEADHVGGRGVRNRVAVIQLPGARKDGVSEVIGRELRATQVGVGKAGSVQLDRTRSFERSVLEVAVRQVRPAQVEELAFVAERGVTACYRPALVAGGALLEHLHGARRGRRGRRVHNRDRLSLDFAIISEVQLPPSLLREALDERNRGCGVLDSHVALASPVTLRWERGTSRRAAAHVRPGQHEAVVDEAPNDGHGTSSGGA